MQNVNLNIFKILEGVPITQFGTFTGRTRIVNNADDLDNVEQNDIIITENLCPNLTIYIGTASGVFVENGGFGVNIIPFLMLQDFPVILIPQITSLLEDGITLTVSSEGAAYFGRIRL